MTRVMWCVAMIVAVGLGGCGKDDAGGGSGGAKAEVARVMTTKLANEAYTRWALRAGANGGCPTTADLAEYVAQQPDFVDPWGRPYVVLCGDAVPAGVQGIAVMSPGPDGKAGTADDVRSWQ